MNYNEDNVNTEEYCRMDNAIHTLISYISYMNEGSSHIDKVRVNVIIDDLNVLKENLPKIDDDTKKYLEATFKDGYAFRGYKNIPKNRREDLMVGEGDIAILFDNQHGPVYWVRSIEEFIKIAEDELVKLAFYSVMNDEQVHESLGRRTGTRSLLEGKFKSYNIEKMISYFKEPERKNALGLVLEKAKQREDEWSRRFREEGF